MTSQVVLGLGSNLGDSLEHLQAGIELLDAGGLRIVAVSPVYETAPIGGPEQGRFMNIVAIAQTDLAPRDVLAVCQHAEAERHRVRVERWGPRTLDVDVISMDDLRSDDADLTLPHPRAAERAFVCIPWCDVQPEAEVPGVGRLVDVIDVLGDQDVVRRDDVSITIPGETS